ncbi:HAD family hydrolase [Siansivirga zeaxanthinifaciens]|uniref:HAD family hydrolase n=1 Tax=Siansivirga zeaxanthinifaciens CC-SAMT-1 TaxID=1454006 RepID=A0A0C5WII4_9FLAO|nr:HAD family hydrolase [Siansivirga zeaxanthinifaciens]AJR02510.1 HAD family hydrolase [Siansivirga zeaxanthinifaciens CC-SAMT-1]
MKKYKCIIFDCDGVLVDTEVTSNQLLVAMANKYGANIDLDYAMKHFKGSHFDDCLSIIKTLVTEDVPQSFETEYRTELDKQFKATVKPIKGVKEVIENLNIPFCVASSGTDEKIRLNLGLVGLLPYFEGKIFSCYTIKKWKPEPDVFLLAAKTMGYKPDECLVIEDSKLGVLGAKNGGFDVYGYTEHDYYNDLESLATKTFNNMTDLLQML